MYKVPTKKAIDLLSLSLKSSIKDIACGDFTLRNLYCDVLQAIEKVKVDKNDKPYQDVKILNVTVPKS